MVNEQIINVYSIFISIINCLIKIYEKDPEMFIYRPKDGHVPRGMCVISVDSEGKTKYLDPSEISCNQIKAIYFSLDPGGGSTPDRPDRPLAEWANNIELDWEFSVKYFEYYNYCLNRGNSFHKKLHAHIGCHESESKILLIPVSPVTCSNNKNRKKIFNLIINNSELNKIQFNNIPIKALGVDTKAILDANNLNSKLLLHPSHRGQDFGCLCPPRHSGCGWPYEESPSDDYPSRLR